MNYARIVNGEVAEYPLTREEIKARFTNVSWPSNGTFAPPAGYVEVAPNKPATTWNQIATEGAPIFNSGVWTESWTVTAMSPAEEAAALAATKAGLLATLANKRWEKETGGMTYSGFALSTDATSQTKYIGAVVGAQMDPTVTLKWKMADGQFVTLDAAAIVGVAMAVRGHVQACFDREAELKATIEAATTPAEIAAVNISTGWPT
jgi:Domain of unknown function (DUF4376)